ncbi:MAG: SDR family NAD(P)-dependent oxidoreductase [Flavobacteriaceae bacterium]|jgi:short-subunit dehydrogenase|nr:SDR family NAD(P)-dependent oxidoreductase [Flavobacteriaceae bacterium]
MKNPFKNKTVWIVGASSGIGQALAENLSEQGARLILSSRNEEKLNEIKNSSSKSENIKIFPLDILKFNELEEKTAQAFAFFGKIDCVFLNSGTSSRGTVLETQIDVHQKIMNLDYFSYVILTQKILPFFIKQKSGHFVVTSSIMGKIGTPLRSAYAAAKHALHGFYDCLRAETAKDGIRVTLLTPGHISTEISFHTLTADGSPKGMNDETHQNGLPADKAAQQILRALARNKNEVYIGKKLTQEHLSLFLFRLCPDLLHKIVRKKIP